MVVFRCVYDRRCAKIRVSRRHRLKRSRTKVRCTSYANITIGPGLSNHPRNCVEAIRAFIRERLKLMMTSVFQSLSGTFCTLNYTVAGYTDGIAKYPNCASQFAVNFTVKPVANISNVTTGDVHLLQYNITNLERCTIYNTFATSLRGGQPMDTVYAEDSVMISKLCITCYIQLYMYGTASNASTYIQYMHAMQIVIVLWCHFVEMLYACSSACFACCCCHSLKLTADRP